MDSNMGLLEPQNDINVKNQTKYYFLTYLIMKYQNTKTKKFNKEQNVILFPFFHIEKNVSFNRYT